METTETKTKWALDAGHSEVHFKVKHLVISTVTGSFKKFNGEMETENEDFSGAKINFNIDAASVDTNSPDRDTHLRSDDFFSSEKYPELKFESTSFDKIDDTSYKLNGNLTIRDVTQPIELKAEYGGMMVDPWGNTKTGFEVLGKVNRKDFGLVWNAVTESGGLLLSDEIKLHINVEFSKQK